MVLGLENTIRFTAVDARDQPSKINGRIIDNNGHTITQISTNDNGIGSFKLVPAEGISYKAVLESTGNELQFYDLPSATPQGGLIETKQTPGYVLLSVRSTLKDSVRLVVHNDQTIVKDQAARDGDEFLISQTETSKGCIQHCPS